MKRHLALENLEERQMLAVTAGIVPFQEAVIAEAAETASVPEPEPVSGKVWNVTSTSTGTSSGSLRYAISNASSGDTIIFDQTLDGKMISFFGTQLIISKTLTIDASALQNGITLNMNSTSRGFYLSSATTLSLDNITIMRGSASGNGGAIAAVNGSQLHLVNCTFRNCSATANGGAVYSEGSIYAEACQFIYCASSASGGGVYSANRNAEFYNCLIAGNSAVNGGGIYSVVGGLEAYQTTIARNSASAYGGGIYVAAANSAPATSFYNCIIVQNKAVEQYTHDLGYNFVELPDILSVYSLTGTDYWTGTEHSFRYDSSLPLFTDSVGGDYTLAVNSQALDLANLDYVYFDTDLAGNERISGDFSDLGAYETQILDDKIPLDRPSILTGDKNHYVSYGLNRHLITWDPVAKAAGYLLSYTEDGIHWKSIEIAQNDTSVVVTGLTYGGLIQYKLKALGDQRVYSDSPWSDTRSFYVNPSDIDNDGFVGPGDLSILSNLWFKSSQDTGWIAAADVDGNGVIAPGDRSFLSTNWCKYSTDADIAFPAAAAEAVFSSADEIF